jgi:hypothetical protein
MLTVLLRAPPETSLHLRQSMCSAGHQRVRNRRPCFSEDQKPDFKPPKRDGNEAKTVNGLCGMAARHHEIKVTRKNEQEKKTVTK